MDAVIRFGWSVLVVWVGALVSALLVGVLAGSAFLTWTAVALGALVLGTAALQLGIQVKEGLVLRMASSLAGALLILAVACAVLAAVYPAAIPAALSVQ